MEAYRFKTQISENGTVAIPNELHLEMQNAEIFVLYNKEIKKETINMASDFIATWSGAFSGIDAEDAKFEYLLKKHK